MKRLVIGAALACASCGSAQDVTAVPPPPPVHVANGTVTAWQTLDPLPVPRANHCAVAANGYLVVVGGNYKPAGATEFVTTADVHVAKIEEGGALGPWQLAGKTPSPVYVCTATSDGADVYVVDGIYDDEALAGHVFRATVSEDGTLSTFEDVGALPQDVRVLGAEAKVEDGVLHALRSRLPTMEENGTITDPGAITLVRAKIEGGRLGPFEESSWLEGFRGYPQLVFAPGFVFALGGYAAGAAEVLADGAGAPVDAEGKPGTFFRVAPLPKPTTSGKAAFVDGWIFVTGGKDKALGANGRADVFAAKVADDGSISEWTSAEPLPQGRTSHQVVVSGDYLYVLGGGFDSGGLPTVFSTRVRFP